MAELLLNVTTLVPLNVTLELDSEYTVPLVAQSLLSVNVTGFAKRGLIHASDFATLMRHNFICGSAIKLKFTVSLV